MEVYEEVSEILAESFSHFRGYTLSDVISGIALCAIRSEKV